MLCTPRRVLFILLGCLTFTVYKAYENVCAQQRANHIEDYATYLQGENYALQMSVAGNFPKERTPGKDEKKEDKEKLDKEFADKRKQFEEKLKNENQFEKWTYLVSNYTIDAQSPGPGERRTQSSGVNPDGHAVWTGSALGPEPVS